MSHALPDADLDYLWRMGQTDQIVRRAYHRLRQLESIRGQAEQREQRYADKADAIRDIVSAAEVANGLGPGELARSGRLRSKHVQAAKRRAMYDLRRIGLSYPEIARTLGLLSHGTVIAALARRVQPRGCNCATSDPERNPCSR